jgi:hypothetical protein
LLTGSVQNKGVSAEFRVKNNLISKSHDDNRELVISYFEHKIIIINGIN